MLIEVCNNYDEYFSSRITSKHLKNERNSRCDFIEREIGIGNVIDAFVVDRYHYDGPEIHLLTSTGIVLIYNLYTKRFITMLIARPAQIERYYVAVNETAPRAILKIAKEHVRNNYHNK